MANEAKSETKTCGKSLSRQEGTISPHPEVGQQATSTGRPRCPPICFVANLVMDVIIGVAGIPFANGLLVILADGADSPSRPVVLADQLSINPIWNSMAVAGAAYDNVHLDGPD
jgi:hypothetical protein